MPVIKSAIKKLRRDRKREKANDAFRKKLDQSLRLAKKRKTPAALVSAVSLIDRAVKKDLIHKNRAARIKSSLSKLAKPVVSSKKPVASLKKSPTTKKSTAQAGKTKSRKTK